MHVINTFTYAVLRIVCVCVCNQNHNLHEAHTHTMHGRTTQQQQKTLITMEWKIPSNYNGKGLFFEEMKMHVSVTCVGNCMMNIGWFEKQTRENCR